VEAVASEAAELGQELDEAVEAEKVHPSALPSGRASRSEASRAERSMSSFMDVLAF